MAMAMKLQGGTHDSDSCEAGTMTAPSNGQSGQDADQRLPSSAGNTESASGTVSSEEERAKAEAEALLRTVAAGPLPAAESLWSDDEECG